MLKSRIFRTSAGMALGLLAAVACLLPPAHGQLPRPRLTSLSRPGARAGEPVEISLRGTDLEGVRELWFDHPGIRAAHVKDLTFRVVPAPDVPLGHHDVRALGTYGVSNPRTFVVGDRPEAVETEPNNLAGNANSISLNTVICGELNGAADVDYFTFEGRRGQRVFFDLEGERIDSRLDATIHLLSADGVEVGESRDVFGADPFLDVTLPAESRYLIKLHDLIYSGSPDHVYRLAVHDGPHLDAILPQAALPGDSSFVIVGRALGPRAAVDPLLSAEGRALERLKVTNLFSADTISAGGTLSSARTFVPSAAAVSHAGFEYAHVRVSPSGSAPVVSNRLFVAHAAGPVVLEQEPNNDDAHAQVVVPPCDISGTFTPRGDVDVFRFQGKKGEVWRVETFADRSGSAADPALVIQKAGVNGQPPQDLAAGDDLPDGGAGARFNTQSVDAELRWQVPDDGLYQVLVSDLYGSQRGHPRLTYRLVMRREQPDFSLVVVPDSATGADSITIDAGGKAPAYAVAFRRDGFAGAVQVEAEQLPAGVRAAPVTIGAGQVVAPIVIEAAPTARSAIGRATFVGRSHFGDRKESLAYVAGASPLGPPHMHEAVAGGMTWPPNPGGSAVAPARLVRGLVVAVRAEPAPLSLSAAPEALVAAQGRVLKIDLTVTRRAGFTEAVAATATDLPPNTPPATVAIAKNASSAVLPLFVPRNVPPGTYTFVVRGTGAYPFSKDPAAKQKPNINLNEPSNPVTLYVRPAPVSLAVNNKGGAVKVGGSLEIDVTVTRQHGFAGSVALALEAPAGSKITAAPIVVAESQTQAKLVVVTAKDSPPGAVNQAFVTAAAIVRGESVLVDEPLALSVNK